MSSSLDFLCHGQEASFWELLWECAYLLVSHLSTASRGAVPTRACHGYTCSKSHQNQQSSFPQYQLVEHIQKQVHHSHSIRVSSLWGFVCLLSAVLVLRALLVFPVIHSQLATISLEVTGFSSVKAFQYPFQTSDDVQCLAWTTLIHCFLYPFACVLTSGPLIIPLFTQPSSSQPFHQDEPITNSASYI